VERAVSDEPENLIPIYLRRIDEKIDRLELPIADLCRRVTSLGSMIDRLHGDFAAQTGRFDRVELRLDRIEQQLEIVPT